MSAPSHRPAHSSTPGPQQEPAQPPVKRSDRDRDVALSVITTCLDEEDNIDALVQRTLATLDRIGVAAEMVIVDDGSRDRTWERITHWSDADNRIRGIRHQQNRGIEAGWKTGLEGSRGAVVCLIDADLQNRPEDIATLYRVWKHQPAAIVQGTRRTSNPPWSRYLLSKGLNLLLNTIFGMRLEDNKSGFLLCRREVLRSIIRHRFTYQYYQCFLTVAAHARGYHIQQVETVFNPRESGRSFLNNMPVRVVGRILWEIVKARIEFRRARKRSGLTVPTDDSQDTDTQDVVQGAQPC